MKFNRRHGGTYDLLHAGFLLGLLIDPEDGHGLFLHTLAHFHRTKRRYIPEDKTLEDLSREYFVRYARTCI
jgi:hypothetical protein